MKYKITEDYKAVRIDVEKPKKHLFPKVRLIYWLKYLFVGCPCHDCGESEMEYQKAIEPRKIVNIHYFKSVKKWGCLMRVLKPGMTVEGDECEDGILITKIY